MGKSIGNFSQFLPVTDKYPLILLRFMAMFSLNRKCEMTVGYSMERKGKLNYCCMIQKVWEAEKLDLFIIMKLTLLSSISGYKEKDSVQISK
jgi:valyl-tRNA synthetase